MRVVTLTLWVLVVLAPLGAQAAVSQLEVVVAAGVGYDWLPPGVTVDSFPSSTGNLAPYANHSGWLAWSADMSGPGMDYGVNDQAIFRRTPDGVTTMLLRRGDQVPGLPEGAIWLEFTPSCLAEDGTLFFLGRADYWEGGGGVTDLNDFFTCRVAPDGTFSILAREGSPAPGMTGAVLTGIPSWSQLTSFQPRCNAAGEAVFTHPITVPSGEEYAIFYVDTAGTTTVLYRTGGAAPGMPEGEELVGFGGDLLINGAGQVSFMASLRTGLSSTPVGGGNDTAFFGPGPDGTITLLAREGDPAPGTIGDFTDVLDDLTPAVANTGAAAFIHYYTYDNWYVEPALWRHDPLNPGVLEPLMVYGDPVPGLPDGWEYGYLTTINSDANGRLSVRSDIRFGVDEWGDALEEADVVWIQDDQGDFVAAARTRTEAPGTGGALYSSINNQRPMNASGQMLMFANLLEVDPVTVFNSRGVWMYTPGTGTELLLRNGIDVEVAPGDTRSLFSISLTSFGFFASGGADGMPISLRDDGSAVLRLGFLGDPPTGYSNQAIGIVRLTDSLCDPSGADCDDGNDCTDDTCDPSTGCVHTPADLGMLACGVGECAAEVAACVDGVAQECVAGMPAEEFCDLRDNDCDGETDEGLACGIPVADPDSGSCLPQPVPTGTSTPAALLIVPFVFAGVLRRRKR